jgi:hypothetical protein
MARIRQVLTFFNTTKRPPICYSTAPTNTLLLHTATPADFPREQHRFPTVHSRRPFDRLTPEVDSCPQLSHHLPPPPDH